LDVYFENRRNFTPCLEDGKQTEGYSGPPEKTRGAQVKEMAQRKMEPRMMTSYGDADPPTNRQMGEPMSRRSANVFPEI